MTEKWDTLTKKELIQLLEPYDDEKHIVFKVNLKRGTVVFWDVKKDEINSDTDKLVLMSKALDKWYAEDIQELVEKNNELKKESYGNLDGLETYKALYSHLSEKFSNLEADYDDLKKENEQLKQFKEDVFNKIDMHLHRLPIARDLEFNSEYGDPSLYSGAIDMLETLKRELSK